VWLLLPPTLVIALEAKGAAAGEFSKYLGPGFGPQTPWRESRAGAGVNRNPPTQIGQSEGGPSVATVNGAEQTEECIVLGHGQQLAIAERPASRCEIAREHPDFTNKWFRHIALL